MVMVPPMINIVFFFLQQNSFRYWHCIFQVSWTQARQQCKWRIPKCNLSKSSESQFWSLSKHLYSAQIILSAELLKMPKKDPCKKYACEIQKCLNSKNFQEGKCQEEIDRLKTCCRTWGRESICCSGFPELWPQLGGQPHRPSGNNGNMGAKWPVGAHLSPNKPTKRMVTPYCHAEPPWASYVATIVLNRETECLASGDCEYRVS